MQKWDYAYISWMGSKIYVDGDLVADNKNATPMPYIKKLGEQGWEMVSVVSEALCHGGGIGTIYGGLRWYFKRPKE